MKRYANYTVSFLVFAACSSLVALAEPTDKEGRAAAASPIPTSTKDPSLVLELGDLDEAPPAINPPQKIGTKETPSLDNRMPASVPSQPDPETTKAEKSQETISTTPTQAPPTTPARESGTNAPVDPLTAQTPAPNLEKIENPLPVDPLTAQTPAPNLEKIESPLPVQPSLEQARIPNPFYPGPFSPIFLSQLKHQISIRKQMYESSQRIPMSLDSPPGQNSLLPTTSDDIPVMALTSKPDGSMVITAVPEVSIILAEKQFVPSVLRLKSGFKTKLFVTSVGKRPSAFVIERLSVQRWIAQHDSQFSSLPAREKPGYEADTITREINSQKISEIPLDPKPGTYRFHDPLSGAHGEIIVE